MMPFLFTPVPNLLKLELTQPPLPLADTLPSWLTGKTFVLHAVAVTTHCTIVWLPTIGFCLLVKLVAFSPPAGFGFFLVSLLLGQSPSPN